VARDLPVALAGEDVGAIVEATRRDKKRTGDHVPFVLLDAPGEPRCGCRVGEAELAAAIGELAAARGG